MKKTYNKTSWIDYRTPVCANNLNNIENAIGDLYENALDVSEIEAGTGISLEKNSAGVDGNNIRVSVDNSVMNIIENSCEYFGSSYLGRHEGTKKLIGITHKAPIIIEESKNLIYFPTTSPRLTDCVWIALNSILYRYLCGADICNEILP